MSKNPDSLLSWRHLEATRLVLRMRDPKVPLLRMRNPDVLAMRPPSSRLASEHYEHVWGSLLVEC